jgi:hypothetical protein
VLSPWLLTYFNNTGHFGFTSAGLVAIKDGINKFSDFEAGKYLIKNYDSWNSITDIPLSFYATFINYPASTISMVISKIIKAWYATDSGRFETYTMILNLPVLFLFLFSGVRTIKHDYNNRVIVLSIISIILAIWLTTVIVCSLFRYMAPIFPFVIIIIFYGFVSIKNRH